MSDRGVIVNRARKQQIINYSGLTFGRITPTDIDGMIEYRGKAFVYYEFKYLDTDIKRGQKIALEQSVKSHKDGGREAIAMILEHNIHDCNKDIPAAMCMVREFYFNPKNGWVKPKERETAYGLTKRFLDWVEAGCKLGA